MKKDRVLLSIPAQPEYLLVVRLTAAGLANRMEFNVEEIEDIKAAVAEACIMLMNQAWKIRDIALEFEIAQSAFGVTARAQGPAAKAEDGDADKDNELSRYLLQALMDGAEVQSENGFINSIRLNKQVAL
jgi:serine/threonine-protein kinase RsbW